MIDPCAPNTTIADLLGGSDSYVPASMDYASLGCCYNSPGMLGDMESVLQAQDDADYARAIDYYDNAVSAAGNPKNARHAQYLLGEGDKITARFVSRMAAEPGIRAYASELAAKQQYAHRMVAKGAPVSDSYTYQGDAARQFQLTDPALRDAAESTWWEQAAAVGKKSLEDVVGPEGTTPTWVKGLVLAGGLYFAAQILGAYRKG